MKQLLDTRELHHSFRKRSKIIQAIDFQNIFKVGKKHPCRCFVIYFRPNNFLYPRLGLSVAKKNVRQAVVRNRIKRLFRESFRYHQQLLTGFDVFVVAYRGIDTFTKGELRQRIDEQWANIISCKKA